jgi:hypothetical protein
MSYHMGLQVTSGDLVTHINGRAVNGSMKRVRELCSLNRPVAELRLVRRNTLGDCEPRRKKGSFFTQCPMFLYEVHARDRLDEIPTAFGISLDNIREDNRENLPLGEKGYVVPGQLLRIRNRCFINEPIRGCCGQTVCRLHKTQPITRTDMVFAGLAGPQAGPRRTRRRDTGGDCSELRNLSNGVEKLQQTRIPGGGGGSYPSRNGIDRLHPVSG